VLRWLGLCHQGAILKISNSGGFTLAEILISAGLGAAIMVIVMTLFYMDTRSYVAMVTRVDSEETLFRVESILKRMARQGLNVRRFNEAATVLAQPEGWIRPVNDLLNVPPTAAAAVGTVFQWGLFKREDSYGASSKIKTTSLFYIPPSNAGSMEYEGVLIVDPDALGTSVINPNYNNSSFVAGSLSNFEVKESGVVYGNVNVVPPALAFQRVLSVDVTVTVRDFTTQSIASTRCWRDRPSCLTNPNNLNPDMGHDKTRTFTILFRDNDFGPNPATNNEARSLESIYFFRDYGRGNYSW
jgi:hypothetical protein